MSWKFNKAHEVLHKIFISLFFFSFLNMIAIAHEEQFPVISEFS